MYTCGVTVYDECHIGHARSLYIFDLIRRYLKYRGFDVKFVRNITDIDDKIINRAKELKIGWQDLVNRYIERYYEDLAVLGIERADYEPRATENIADMIKYITALIAKGYAYPAGSDVYFDVRKFPKYGQLSRQNIDQMRDCVRIEPAECKRDPLDFALWKGSKEDEPFWDSPWGRGRPGWHIECSVMSQKYLKTDTLDIHAGGRDLVFPHHENEIAQSEALTGKHFAKYWIHHGLLTINGQKMAKSAGNFVTIKYFMERYKKIEFLKLFFLSAHYSHPVDFTEEKIEEAKKAYDRFRILFQKLGKEPLGIVPESAKGKIDQLKGQFEMAMDDDFNTPEALSVLFNMVNECNKMLSEERAKHRFALKYASKVIVDLGKILGLSFKDDQESMDDEWVNIAIAKRVRLKKEKKYKEADVIRKTLEQEGIILEDTKDGRTIWRRKL